jgi:chloride channel protein, CIC family
MPEPPSTPSRRVLRVPNRIRRHRLLPLAAIVGAVTGLGVAVFDWVTVEVLLHAVLERPWWQAALAPTLGLALAAASLRWLGRGAEPGTADEYIRSVHGTRHLGLRDALGRFPAAVATLGLGGSLGLEGPSVYAGAVTGAQVARRLRLSPADLRLLLAAGAAAGVAAIFRTPLTAVVFAVEVPYKDDLGRRMLLPALVGAAAGYTVYVLLLGTDPLFRVFGDPALRLPDLGFAALLGAACGFGARAYASLFRAAKRTAGRVRPVTRILGGGAVLFGCAALSLELFDETLTLGPGYRALDWIAAPERALGLLAALLVLRVVASTATLGAGGVGGLFVPLVVAGAIVGRFVGGLHAGLDTTLYSVIGVAAFLGAGYQVPLAAVVFVAEISGSPAYVVPGLIAAVIADLVAGDSSVTPYQQARA